MPIAGSLWLLLEMELLPSYALNGALTPNPAILSALKRIFCLRMRAVASRSRLVDSDPALTRFGSVEELYGQGSSISRPAWTAWIAVGCSVPAPGSGTLLPFGIAHQSDSTKPLKPKSVRRMSFSRWEFCVAFDASVPPMTPTWLYDAMIEETPPSWMIMPKWRA